MTPTELQRLKEICDKATPGPWTRSSVHHYDQTLTYIENNNDEIVIETASGIGGNNSKFIAEARTAMPALIQEVERLRVDRDIWDKRWLSKVERLEKENARLKEDIEALTHEGRQGELEQANVGLAEEDFRLREALYILFGLSLFVIYLLLPFFGRDC